MKKYLLPLLTSAALLSAGTALAQEKPSLNTAPPGAVPAPVSPAPQPVQTVPVKPTDPVVAPAPATRPTPSSPSGLELPSSRDAQATGSSSSEPLRRYFIYTGFGLGYSGYNGYSQFNIGASPAIGYRLTDKLAAGPGISYTYNNYSVDASNGTRGYSVSTSSFGVKVFAQYVVYKEFFAHAEYEQTKAELIGYDQNYKLAKGQFTITSPLAGVGYRSQFSDRVAADILLLYNFNDGANGVSLYSNPVLRFNFLFYLGK